MAERGLPAAHTAVMRRVRRYAHRSSRSAGRGLPGLPAIHGESTKHMLESAASGAAFTVPLTGRMGRPGFRLSAMPWLSRHSFATRLKSRPRARLTITLDGMPPLVARCAREVSAGDAGKASARASYLGQSLCDRDGLVLWIFFLPGARTPRKLCC